MNLTKKRRRFRKTLKILGISLTSASLGIILDMLIARSIYHPLTYLYSGLNWLECRNSAAQFCNSTPTSTSSSPVVGQLGMVVSEQHEASKVGLQILSRGGNAIDAAVAVGYALAVTYPCCGNLGGGGFMTIRLANGQTRFLDFREKAPGAATPTMYLDAQGKVIPDRSTKGYLAVGVPGTVKGLDYALKTYGTLSREQVIAPAIALANQGFILQAGDVAILKSSHKLLAHNPNSAAIFLNQGHSYQVGERLIQKNLAQTLQQIAKQGPDAFYKGAIAKELVQASQIQGGILALPDLANYTVAERQPIQCRYREYTVYSAPPPGGGTTLCEMLNILAGYPLSQTKFHSAASLHWMLQSMLYAYADRNTYLGDPDFVRNPVDHLLSKSYAAQIRARINTSTQAADPEQIYSSQPAHEGNHTTQYTISDRRGNIVSVTYTLNSFFGAGVIAGKTGFFLNNEMDDFAILPGTPNKFGLVQGTENAIAPGKRPLSSMSPTLVMKGNQPIIAEGSPGGPTITTTVLQVLINVCDYKMNLQAAVDAPRIHYQGLPNIVLSEPYALSNLVFQQLWQRGYRVIPLPHWGGAESIAFQPKTKLVYGANDSRKPTGQALAEK